MDVLTIADRTFSSRLMVGTGKFSSADIMRAAVDASGAEIITVALRRVDLKTGADPMVRALDRQKHLLLPNTSGARDADEAVRLARLGRQLSGTHWLKLEVTPDPKYLLPDPIETLKAAEILVKEGFVVLPYINADPVLAKRLEEAGTATIMPLGAPIGSNRGLQTRENIRIIIEQANIPVVVDAGLGAPSHAAEAMEMGADAVMLNTALSVARDPVAMAHAFRLGVQAGRLAYLASSPLTGFLREKV
jgi:thiazole synthase